jgi:hypothetical protein
MWGVFNFGQNKSDMKSVLHEADIEFRPVSQNVFIVQNFAGVQNMYSIKTYSC